MSKVREGGNVVILAFSIVIRVLFELIVIIVDFRFSIQVYSSLESTFEPINYRHNIE
jgi:hypothetical protein